MSRDDAFVSITPSPFIKKLELAPLILPSKTSSSCLSLRTIKRGDVAAVTIPFDAEDVLGTVKHDVLCNGKASISEVTIGMDSIVMSFCGFR